MGAVVPAASGQRQRARIQGGCPDPIRFFYCGDISERIFSESHWEGRLEWSDTDAGRELKGMVDAQGNWDQEKFASLLIELSEISLVDTWIRDDSGFVHLCLHPLIKDWILLRTAINTFFDYARLAANLPGTILGDLRESGRFSGFNMTQGLMNELFSHIMAHEENIRHIQDADDVDGGEFIDTYDGAFHESEVLFAQFMEDMAHYGPAEVIYRRIVALHEWKYGPEDPRTLKSLGKQAVVMCDQGKYEMAEKLKRHLYERLNQLFGPDDDKTVLSMNRLAITLSRQQKFTEAHDLYEAALQIAKRVKGPDHPETLQIMANLAWDFRLRGRYEEAVETYQLVISIQENILGPDDREVMDTILQLAAVREDQKAYDEEPILYERAHNCFKKELGEDNGRHRKYGEKIEELKSIIESMKGESNTAELGGAHIAELGGTEIAELP